MLPSPDILNQYEHGKFVLANLAAKRAKQLREGAMPLVQVNSHHPLTIALAEIAAGKIKPSMTKVEEGIITHDMALIEEHAGVEFGMLLPALDESEITLIEELHKEDAHDEEEHADVNLSDLIGGEEEEVTAAVADDTLSLSDIAEQESADESEDEQE